MNSDELIAMLPSHEHRAADLASGRVVCRDEQVAIMALVSSRVNRRSSTSASSKTLVGRAKSRFRRHAAGVRRQGALSRRLPQVTRHAGDQVERKTRCQARKMGAIVAARYYGNSEMQRLPLAEGSTDTY